MGSSRSILDLWQLLDKHQNLGCAKLSVTSAVVVKTMTCVVPEQMVWWRWRAILVGRMRTFRRE